MKFQYINGALEDTKQRDENSEYILSSQGIREHICDILESKRLKFTPVSIEMGLGTTVLTGANMGGKSVTLKTVAWSLRKFMGKLLTKILEK